MTREEIREGIKHVIMLDEGMGQATGKYPDLTQHIIEYLHSQGVVIKSKRELPDCDFCHGKGKCTFASTAGYMETYEGACLKCGGTGKDMAGYVAVEPLIEK